MGAPIVILNVKEAYSQAFGDQGQKTGHYRFNNNYLSSGSQLLEPHSCHLVTNLWDFNYEKPAWTALKTHVSPPPIRTPIVLSLNYLIQCIWKHVQGSMQVFPGPIPQSTAEAIRVIQEPCDKSCQKEQLKKYWIWRAAIKLHLHPATVLAVNTAQSGLSMPQYSHQLLDHSEEYGGEKNLH